MRAARPIALLAGGLLAIAWIPDADAGKRKRRAGAEAPATPPPPPEAAPPFHASLPVDAGPLPDGLANATSQACAACHPDTVAAWAGSAHAGPPSEALRRAATAAGDPACTSCHLPLTQQHASPGPDSAPHAAWSPSLAAEGVTCAACHVRGGAVLAGEPPAPAPHAAAWSSQLRSPELCASCHQLTWPGATVPLYDTYGEWQASAWAEAGVICQDCHMGPDAGAARRGTGHDVRADTARSVSVLVDFGADRIVRGAPPVAGTITLQNTGAGHHVPSGSPFVAYVVEAELVPPAGDAVPLATHRLAQSRAADAPFAVEADTRLPAGGTVDVEVSLALGQDADPGTWRIRVRIVAEVGGTRTQPPRLVREVPIPVE